MSEALAPPPFEGFDECPSGTVEVGAGQALVQRYFEMWNTGDWAAADAVLGASYLDHAYPSVIGPATVRSLVRRFHSSNPEARMTIEIVAASSEYVVVRRAIRWTLDGDAEPCGPALFRVAAGKLAEQWSWSPPAGQVPVPDPARAWNARAV